MNKTMRKDFFMEIRKSLGRFLSIFFIVALGVAFFSGIRATQPSMITTGDVYFDKNNLMDIKAISTLGLTEEDIEAVSKVEGVEYAVGAYSVDVLCRGDANQKVLHIMSLTEDMNTIDVIEGRLPEKADECLVDARSSYNIGDTIWVESGTDTPITDSLVKDKLTVVGRGSSTCYISLNRGSTTIGTGSVSAFVIVPENAFCMDVYTELYVRVEGAKDLIAYTDEYENLVEEVMERIEDITDERGKIRREDVVAVANEELADAQKELDDAKAKVEEELADAWAQITDGEAQLNDAKAQIADGETQLEQARNTLKEKQQELNTAKTQYKEGYQQYQDGLKQYNEGYAQYEQGQAAYNEGYAQYEQGLVAYQAEVATYKEQIDQYEALKAYYEANKDVLDEATRQGLEYQIAEAEKLLQPLWAAKASLDQAKMELDSNKAILDATAGQLAESKAVLDATNAQLTEVKAQLEDGQAQILSGWQEISKQEDTLEEAKTKVSQSEADLAEAKEEYEKGKLEAEEEIEDAEAELADAREEIENIGEAKWYVYDRSTLPENDGLGENADRIKAIGKVFPVLFFLVAALISLTSMTRMVEEQRTHIGTMKALGYSKFAISSKYLGYALVATLGGSVLGVLVGEKVIPLVIVYAYCTSIYPYIVDFILPYNLYYGVLATVAAMFCTIAATMFSCYKELAAQPAVLMRPPTPKKGKRVFMERITFVWKHLSFIWKSTFRNLFRYKKRFFMTVFGIGGCMGLLLLGFGLKDSIFEIADVQYEEIQLYDGMAYLYDDNDQEEKDALYEYLDTDKDVNTYINMYMSNVTLINGSEDWDVYMSVPEDAEDFKQFVDLHDRISQEKYELTDEGIILNEKAAKMLGVEKGDVIELEDLDHGNHEVKINEICENYMGHYLYMTKGLYEEIYGETYEPNCIFFTTESKEQKQIEKTGTGILKQDAVLNVSYLFDTQSQLEHILSTLNLVVMVLIISAGMLAFVVLYNLNNINITERRRELATLKVLGFYDGEVSAYVYRENIILTFIGAAAGVILGNFLHQFVIQTVEVEAVMFGRVINFPSYIYSVLFTFAFSAFVNWIMHFKLKKIDMVESLKSVE